MTQPPEVSTTAKGRDGGRGNRPATSIWLAGLRWCVVAAFLLRAALSLLDARDASIAGARALPITTSVQVGVASPVWPLLWGALALVTAAALALRIRIAWLLGVAVTIAYLVSGIADVTALAATPALDSLHLTETGAVELCVPLLILAGLIAIRSWYLPVSKPLSSLGRGLESRARLRHAGAGGVAGPGGVAGSSTHGATPRRGTPRGGPSLGGSTLDRWRRRT